MRQNVTIMIKLKPLECIMKKQKSTNMKPISTLFIHTDVKGASIRNKPIL